MLGSNFVFQLKIAYLAIFSLELEKNITQNVIFLAKNFSK